MKGGTKDHIKLCTHGSYILRSQRDPAERSERERESVCERERVKK